MSKTAADKTSRVADPVVSETNPSAPVVETESVSVVKPTARKAPTKKAPAKASEKLAEPVVASTPVAPKQEAKVKPAKPVKASKEKKPEPKKPKLVRDSFTFPESDYAQIAALKQRALNAGVEIKKSEVLRAALVALSKLSDAELLSALEAIDKLKTGRPAK
jgi:hypothetical protein